MTAAIPPGFTVLCVDKRYGLVQDVARAVGRRGRTVACGPSGFDWPHHAGQMPVQRCVCGLAALPFLSHSVDVVVGHAGLPRTEGFAAEVRRVLTPAGLFVGYACSTQTLTLAACAERMVEAGLELVDEEPFAKRLGISAPVLTARAPLRGRTSVRAPGSS